MIIVLVSELFKDVFILFIYLFINLDMDILIVTKSLFLGNSKVWNAICGSKPT